MLSTKQKTAIIIAGIFVVGIFIFYMTTKTNNNTNDYSIVNEAIQDKADEDEKQEEKKEEPKEIVIHISGAVQNEGIVKLEEGGRIADAIQAAGGMTSEADLTSVNLAYLLKDGQKIYIPKISDTEEEIPVNNAIPVNVIVGNGTEESSNSNTKININTATVSELTKISGVGEKTAMKIVEHREANGKFKTIEDIKSVSGIGDAKYESIKEYICVN